jgi:hypothetical protein
VLNETDFSKYKKSYLAIDFAVAPLTFSLLTRFLPTVGNTYNVLKKVSEGRTR